MKDVNLFYLMQYAIIGFFLGYVLKLIFNKKYRQKEYSAIVLFFILTVILFSIGKAMRDMKRELKKKINNPENNGLSEENI